MGNSRKLAFLANLINNTGNIPITTISDIDISSVAGSQALVYDTVSGKWKNSTINISSTGTSDQVNTSTGFFMIPSGTTAQRPASPQYGALRYNTTTGLAEVYSPNGWSVFGTPPPQISSVSPGTYNGESGSTFTVNGAYFTNDVGVKFIDSSNTEYNATTVTLVNSSTLTVTTPQDFTVAQGPLDVKIIQASGITTLTDCISTGGSPTWTTTAGQIGGTIYRNGSVSTSVAATDPDSGATITYSVYSGALPTGLSLNTSTGAITGTAPNVGSDTTYNFTLRATDNAGNTANRAFSMIVLQGSPGTPTIGTATRSASQSVQVAFTAPANTGGSTPTYTVTSNPGNFTATGATSPITVTGLTNGTTYTFTVTATNSYGTSASSSASNSATPSTTPSAPTIGTATVVNGSTATVTFTASASNGGAAITSYTAVSSPGSITGTLSQSGSGTITVSGLTSGTAYTFTVYATNAAGNSSSSSASNSITPVTPPGQAEYTSPGTYTWYAPAGVTSVSALAIGSGAAGTVGGPTYNGLYASGGGGGGLGWKNNISVTPGNGYTVVVGQGGYQPGPNYYYDDEGPADQQAGADSYFISSTTVKGGGAPKPLTPWTQTRNSGGTYVGDGGGNGGTGGYEVNVEPAYTTVGLGAGGGGAGGYSGAGGAGALGQVNGTGTAGSGGGGGGCGGVNWYGDAGMYTHGSNDGKTGGGGGTGLYGQGSNGAGGQYLNAATGGGGGSGGASGAIWNTEQYGTYGGGTGGAYGGGGGGNVGLFDATLPGAGGNGAVRIMWLGGRSYPSNAANA